MQNKLKVTQAEIANEIQKVAAIVNKDPRKVAYHDMLRHGSLSEKSILQAGGLPAVKATFFKSLFPADDAEIRDNSDIRNQIRGLRNKLGDIEGIARRMEKAVEDMDPIKVSGWMARRSTKKFMRTVQLIISDTHFGSDIDAGETGKTFGPVEEARALAYIAKNACEYKIEHRKETCLIVNVLGDMIENHLHAGGASDALHLQVCRAIHLLVQFLGVLAKNYPSVKVNFSVGNHGRDKAIHMKRATASKYNAVETSIYYAIRVAFRDVKNVEFNQPMTPWVDWDVYGFHCYAAHGDTNFNVGQPEKSINVKSILDKTNAINAARAAEKMQPYALYMVGHCHTPSYFMLSNGVQVITNGSLPTAGPYLQSLDIMRSQQVQIMFESTEQHLVGDVRYINAMGSDKDKSLDKIITPWKGL